MDIVIKDGFIFDGTGAPRRPRARGRAGGRRARGGRWRSPVAGSSRWVGSTTKTPTG